MEYNMRPVAVGEAERRATERAVVDNMKEAYVSVLAPSQLGVGIPAGDSVLIHGVRLIAEKLGPRAVIVHTDLRNAYNEAWRRTIIQRHIDCSPLHPVIPALLASLSTDSYLVVDDRSAPLRSEDCVQQGAPLATTSFCVAIHPEVQQCDTTLEVNDGAARFNADDGFLVGLPEHVWPALHAFRTSIKASVGLEVRFDKMQAYNADMEAARREAPADIEWPELDGHHGIAVLNVPLGSPEYVQAYMRGKAEELREEVDASLSKLLSAKPNRRYTHALHHHAWALLKHCMQHKVGYWLRNCLPSEVEAFAEAVDATILAAVERVLGVSFDPSTYGTDTNPVVTDFLAELLHDPDPMAAEVATLSEDAVARARSRLHLPTRLKGAGIRRMATVRDAAFIGCMNAILPRFLTRNSGTDTPTPGFFDPQLGSVLGRGSFNANVSARQYDHFLNDAHGSDSYAAEMREAWGRLQAATAGHLRDADARQMEREVEAASGSQKELTAFLDQANNSRLRNEVCALPATSGVRALQRQHAPAAASAAHDAALSATARWCATNDVYRKMPRTPLRGTAVGVCPAARLVLFPRLDRTLAYADRFPPTDDRSYGAEGTVCVFAGLLLRPYPSSSPAVVRKLAERRVRLSEAGDAVRAGFSVCGMQQLWRESRDGSELHNYQMEAGGADAAADGVPPAVVDAHRRAAKLTAVQELRRARQALDTADLGMVSDAAAALPALDALHPPHAATGPEYSPPEEPPDLQRASPLNLDVTSWRMWVNRCLAGRGHSRTAAFLASRSIFALHKDDPAAREEREKSGEPLRVRPLGVGSVLTGFLSRMMPPSELDPFLEDVDAANISAAFSLLGMDACDQSTPRMEAAIVQMSMPADFGGLNLVWLQSEAPAAFYSAQSVVLPKLVREYGPALGPLYEAVRAEVSSVATSECFAMGA
eukprot:jgi/Tetstr1/455807/TSEL_042599.t1